MWDPRRSLMGIDRASVCVKKVNVIGRGRERGGSGETKERNWSHGYIQRERTMVVETGALQETRRERENQREIHNEGDRCGTRHNCVKGRRPLRLPAWVCSSSRSNKVQPLSFHSRSTIVCHMRRPGNPFNPWPLFSFIGYARQCRRWYVRQI